MSGTEYHKIQSLYKRGDKGEFLETWSRPEWPYLADNEWIWTEKVDGTNIRVLSDGETVTFGGRTDNAQTPMTLVTRLHELFLRTPAMNEFCAQVDGPFVLYGEGFGAGIQKGGGYGPVDFVLFDVTIGGLVLDRENVEDIAKRLGIQVVPVIGRGDLSEAEAFVKNGFNSTWGDFPAEGIVVRPSVELQTRRGERVILKLKTRDYEARA